jgi:hypothetical protein
MTDLPRYWTPLQEISVDDFTPVRPEIIKESMNHYGITAEEAKAMLAREHAKGRYFVNDLYQVQLTPCGPDDSCYQINIRRRDGAAHLRDWRHFQQIKNEVVGEEREALELYPAESRKVDTSNKWHLWVLPEGVAFGLGWMDRDVQYEESRDVPGMRQRPL